MMNNFNKKFVELKKKLRKKNVNAHSELNLKTKTTTAFN